MMSQDNVNGPESQEPQDLLSAWRGQVRELESPPAEIVDEGAELLSKLRAIAVDLARGPATPPMAQLPAAAESTAQAEVVEDAIIEAEAAPVTTDVAITSPFDYAALNAAIAALEDAAKWVLARADSELTQTRDAVRAEVGGIREALGAELKLLRDEIQRAQRRAQRHATDNAPRVLNEQQDSPVVAKLTDACTHLEALREQTDKLSAALSQQRSQPTPQGEPNTANEINALRALIDDSIGGLRKDVQTYATAERKIAQSAIAAAEKTIEKLQSRVSSATADADQRLGRLTATIQSAVERAERTAVQAQAAFSATEALRAEASGAVGNWRDEALRIVRDALARMATETAGAANQAKEARKTVIAETRSLRAELLKNAESAHAAVMSEIRRELEQTRTSFEEQRKELAAELNALEKTRREHEESATVGRKKVDEKLAEAEDITRQEIERLDAAYRDLATHLAQVGVAKERIIQAVDQVEARANSELAPVSRSLADLRDARANLEAEHKAALESVRAAHAAITPETDRLRVSIDRLNAEAERVAAQVAPLADARKASDELTASSRQSVADALDALREAQKALDQQHRVAIDLITDTHAALSTGVRRELNHARAAFTAQRKELGTEQQRLTAIINDLASRSERLSASFDEFGATRERVAQAGDELIAAREVVAGAASDIGVAKLELAAAKEGFGVAAADVAAVARQAEEARGRIEAQAEQLERELREELEALSIARHEYEAAATDLRLDIGAAAEVHEEQLAALRQQLGHDREQLSAWVGTIDDRAQQFTATLDKLRKRTEEYAQLARALESTNQHALGSSERITIVASEIEQLIERHQAALADVRAEYRSVLEAVAAQLRTSIEAQHDQSAALAAEMRTQIATVSSEQRAQFAANDERLAVIREQIAGTNEYVLGTSERLNAAAAALDTLRGEFENLAADYREQLAAATTHHRAQIESLANDLGARVDDQIGRAANELRGEYRSALGVLDADLKELAAQQKKGSEALLAALHREAESLAAEQRRQIAAGADQLGAIRGQLSDAHEQMTAWAAAVEQRVQQAGDTLGDLHSRIDDYARLTQQLASTNEHALGTSERLTVVANELDHLVTAHTSSLGDVRAEYQSALSQLREELRSAVADLGNEVRSTLARQQRQSTELADALRGEMETYIRQSADQVREELSVVTDALRDQLERATIAENEVEALRQAAEQKRDDDDAAALERAVGMLSVLESLDDAVRSLAGQESEEARRRIAHFEREARAMARLVELEEIATDGEIDESRHEVVDVVADDTDNDRIVEVRQRGYAFRDRVIRPAQVVVNGARVGGSAARAESQLTL